MQIKVRKQKNWKFQQKWKDKNVLTSFEFEVICKVQFRSTVFGALYSIKSKKKVRN